MNTFNKIVFVVIALLVFCGSPAWEYMSRNVRIDQVAINVCWRRFGPLFPQRWSCESMIKQNIMAISFSCAFNKDKVKEKDDENTKQEICEELDKVTKEQEELKAQMKKVETGGGP